MTNFEELLYSPFQPGYPVSPDNFKGRNKDISKILRYLPRVIDMGLPEHFFITGKRGMGKTSFVKHVGHLAEDMYDMVYIYINNEGTNTITELITNLLDVLFKEFNKKSWGQKIIKSFFNHFQEIDIQGFGFKFKDEVEIVDNIKKNFIEFLVDLCDNLEDKSGIFIIIDDINGLSDTPEFANWYKALFETLDANDEFVPISFTLVTYPHKFDQLYDHNPSFSRMFNVINIDRLDDGDVEEFYTEIFEKYGVFFEKKQYLDDMVYYSCGMPLVMQQIGDSVFWNIDGNSINEKAVYDGISDAGFELENKQIKSILNKIDSPIYMNILSKLGFYEKVSFRKDEFSNLLYDREREVFDDFLKEMVNLNILEIHDEKSPEYEFTNIIYFVYFLINSNFRKIIK